MKVSPVSRAAISEPDVRREARGWAVKLSAGQPTRGDVTAFRRWRDQSPAHAQAWAYVCADRKALDGAARIVGQRDAYTAPRRAPRPRRLFLGAAATACGALAVAALVHPPMGLWPSWPELGADYRTSTGQQRALRLGGGVQVAMNTQTSLSVQEGGAAPRISLIAGEAAISSADAVCDVQAGDVRIRVTHGDVEVRRLADGQVRVRCREGAVQVAHPSGVLALQASQQVVYDGRTLGAPARLAASGAEWRQGVVVFDDLALVDVVDEINRYRPGRVVLVNQALAGRRFSARFAIPALDDAIELLHAGLGVTVRRVGDVVFLS